MLVGKEFFGKDEIDEVVFVNVADSTGVGQVVFSVPLSAASALFQRRSPPGPGASARCAP